MARINIEDSLYADPRFMRFMLKVGDEGLAIGLVVMSFRLAQKFWCPNMAPIPEEDWEVSGLPDSLIECGLVKLNENGYYVRGSEAQFAWWFQRQEAGKKGGRPKKPVGNRPLSSDTRTVTGVNRLEPSSSSSSSSSSSEEIHIETQKAEEAGKREESAEGLRSEIEQCVDVWQSTLDRLLTSRKANWDKEPIARLVHRYGVERTKLALIGIGYEPKSKDYDPASGLYVYRLVQKPNVFDRCVTLGAQREAVEPEYFQRPELA